MSNKTPLGNAYGISVVTDDAGQKVTGFEIGGKTTNVLTTEVNDLTGGMVISAGKEKAVVGTYQPELIAPSLDVPSAISGLALWLDASDPMYTTDYAARVSGAADTVAVWPDKSGNGNVLTPVGSPKFSPSGHNGKPAVAFNANSYFTISGLLTAAFDSAFTLFIVASRSDTSGNAVSVGTLGTKNFYAQRDTAAKLAGLSANGLVPAGGTVKTTNSAFTEMYVFDGSSATIFADGFCRAESATSLSAVSGAMTTATTGTTGINAQALGIGALNDGTYKWPGTISEIILYSSPLSDTDQQRVLKYLAAKWNPGKRAITCVGDSLTSGTGSTGGANQAVSIAGSNYPGQLWGLLGAAGYSVRIEAYPGRTLTQALAEKNLSEFVGCTESGRPITIVWIGTNSLTICKSAGAVIQFVQRECLAYKKAGHVVIVANCLTRGDAIYAGFENDRTVLNSFLAANYTAFADALADVAGDTRLQDYNNATYFAADKIHLTDSGYGVVAELIKPLVQSI